MSDPRRSGLRGGAGVVSTREFPSTEGSRARFRQANPFFVEQARQPTHGPPISFVGLVRKVMLLSWPGGMDLSLLVFTLVSCSSPVVCSLWTTTDQHYTIKSVMTEYISAHDGEASSPSEFSLTKPFLIPECSSVNISNMYLSSNTIIKTLFGITGSPRLLFWCFESAYGRQRPILWKPHIEVLTVDLTSKKLAHSARATRAWVSVNFREKFMHRARGARARV